MRTVVSIVVVLIVVGLLTGYWMLTSGHRRALDEIRETAAMQRTADHREAVVTARELAEDTARILATAIAPAVIRGEFGALEGELAAMVRGHRLAGIIVLDRAGVVLATTDRRWAGRTLDDPMSLKAMDIHQITVAPEAPAPGQIEVQAPLVVGSERVGTLRVMVELGSLAAINGDPGTRPPAAPVS